MVLRKNLWYYTKNSETSIYEGKNMVDYQKLSNFDLLRKNYGKMSKQLKFLNKIIALELWFTMKKLWYYGNTMVVYRKLWNFDLLWNYDTMEKL